MFGRTLASLRETLGDLKGARWRHWRMVALVAAIAVVLAVSFGVMISEMRAREEARMAEARAHEEARMAEARAHEEARMAEAREYRKSLETITIELVHRLGHVDKDK